MDIHLREMLAHHHDQAGVRHNQCVRTHGNHRLQVTDKGFQFGVMRGDIDHDIEFLAQFVGFLNAFGEVFMVKFVVTDTQAVTWLSGIDRIRTIGERIAHILQRARRRE